MIWFPLFLFAVIVLLARQIGRPWFKPWTAHLDTMQSVLTVAAISFGINWYFFERPDSAKIDLTQAVQGFPIGDDGTLALVLIDISLKNVGGAALRFNDEPFAIFLQQVTPVTQAPWNEHVARADAGLPAQLVPADNWSLVGAIIGGAYPRAGLEGYKFDHTPGLSGIVEAGETDSYYFRTIVSCKPGLRLGVSSRFDKPLTWYEALRAHWRKPEPLRWIKASVLDLSAVCAPKLAAP